MERTKMSQILKPALCFVISILFLLQLGNAQKDDVMPVDAKQDYEAPFVKKIKEIHNSQFAKKTRELTGLTLQGLGEMLKKVEHEINNNSKKREIEPHSLVPNFIKNDVVDPSLALGKVLMNTASEPIISYTKDVQNKFKTELEKIKDEENPSKFKKLLSGSFAFRTAASTVTADRLKTLKNKGTEFWNSGKTLTMKQNPEEVKKTK